MDEVSEGEIFELKIPVGKNRENSEVKNKVGQEQIHGLLFSDKLSWQSIIYDLINTEQLDPWDIDLALLSTKFLERVRELEEANLFVSSKVLFAASLLLRIKSEILLNHYIPSLDSILFGEKEDKKYIQERIELEGEVPELVQRTPLPRFRRVTLQELMTALGKAVVTENRRIERVVLAKQQEFETAISLPKRTINIKDKINQVYSKLKDIFSLREDKITFTELVKSEDKVEHFVPLLHLDFQHKVLLEQEKHLEEIWIWLKEHHESKFKDELEKKRKEVEEFSAMLEKQQEANDLAEKELEKTNGKKKVKKGFGKNFGKKKNVDEDLDDEEFEELTEDNGIEEGKGAEEKIVEDINKIIEDALRSMF